MKRSKLLITVLCSMLLSGCNNNSGKHFDVTFMYNTSIDGKDHQVVEVKRNECVNPIEISREGYSLDGWYTDNDTFSYKYDFTSRVKNDLTLYAKWDFINIPLESLSFTDTAIDLALNDEKQLEVIYTPSNTTEREVSYTSSNAEICSVDQTGKITALKAGDATISVTSVANISISGSISVHVTDNRKVTTSEAKDAFGFKDVNNLSITRTTETVTDYPFYKINDTYTLKVDMDDDLFFVQGIMNSGGYVSTTGYIDYFATKGITKTPFDLYCLYNYDLEDYGLEKKEDGIYEGSAGEVMQQYVKADYENFISESYYVDEDELYYSCGLFDQFDEFDPSSFFVIDDIDFDSMTFDEEEGCYNFTVDSIFGFEKSIQDYITCEASFKSIKVFFLDKQLNKVEICVQDSDGYITTDISFTYTFSNYGKASVAFPDVSKVEKCDHEGQEKVYKYNDEGHFLECDECEGAIGGTYEKHTIDPETHKCTVCDYLDRESVMDVVLTREVFGRVDEILYYVPSNTIYMKGMICYHHLYSFTQKYDYILMPDSLEPVRCSGVSFGANGLFYGHGQKAFCYIPNVGYVFPETYTFETRNIGGSDVTVMVVTKVHHDLISL